MNKMTGIILMIIGILIFVIGVIAYSTSKKPNEKIANNNELEKVIEMAIADGVLTDNERKLIKQTASVNDLNYDEIIVDVEKQISELKTDSETEIIDVKKKNGDDFEKFIVQKFDKKYFRIKEWAGDKYVNGVYAETTPQPDILLEFHHKKDSAKFWVECKWRQNSNTKSIQFASEKQFERYKNYQKERNIPVFVAIGLGGKASSPEQLFIVPLSELKYNYVYLDYLSKFEKNVNSDFFFDSKTNVLK